MKYLILTYIAFLFANPGVSNKSYSSSAFDLETKKLIYYEKHNELIIGSKKIWQTNYVSPDEEVLSQRLIVINADSLRPDFELKDYRTGYIEGAEKINDNKIRIYTRESFSDELEEDTLSVNNNFIVDAGLTFFFRKNWKKLLNEEMIKFNFIAPSKLDYYGFRVYKNKEYKIDSDEVIDLILEPSSFIIRQFVDPIYISYYRETKKIVRYKGISNVNDPEGSSYRVLINYLTESIN